ncbi:hypothetical protein [Streptomyces sp. NPDC015345]|uniref:hypothetical protein n=1 Tax=Streptomyces sp. NPDC015345 TaxID=3364953 RepID=UPI003702E4E8
MDENLPEEPDLIYLDEGGQRKPTKRAEALCFVYSGGPVRAREANPYDDGEGPAFLHDILALALVSARNKLQKLKQTTAPLRNASSSR